MKKIIAEIASLERQLTAKKTFQVVVDTGSRIDTFDFDTEKEADDFIKQIKKTKPKYSVAKNVRNF